MEPVASVSGEALTGWGVCIFADCVWKQRISRSFRPKSLRSALPILG
jgi:hypothetical protein